MAKRNLNERNLEIDVPQLCLEWNYNKNNLKPKDFYKSDHTKVWWICIKGHEWEASIHARSCCGTGCPYCANKKVCKDNCLDTIFEASNIFRVGLY